MRVRACVRVFVRQRSGIRSAVTFGLCVQILCERLLLASRRDYSDWISVGVSSLSDSGPETSRCVIRVVLVREAATCLLLKVGTRCPLFPSLPSICSQFHLVQVWARIQLPPSETDGKRSTNYLVEVLG